MPPPRQPIMFEELKEWRQHMAKKRMARFDKRYIILAGDTMDGTRYLERDTKVHFFTGESKDDKVCHCLEDLFFAYNLKDYTREFYTKRVHELGVQMMQDSHKERLFLFMSGKLSNNDFLGEIELLKPLPEGLDSPKVLAVGASGRVHKVPEPFDSSKIIAVEASGQVRRVPELLGSSNLIAVEASGRVRGRGSQQNTPVKLKRKLSLDGSPVQWKEEKKLHSCSSDSEVEFVCEDIGSALKRKGNTKIAASGTRASTRPLPAQPSFSLKEMAKSIEEYP